jgi:hypothetical protein
MASYSGFDSNGNSYYLTEVPSTGDSVMQVAGALGEGFTRMGLTKPFAMLSIFLLWLENAIVIALATMVMALRATAQGKDITYILIVGLVLALIGSVIPLMFHFARWYREIARYMYPASWLVLGFMATGFLGMIPVRIIAILALAALSFLWHRVFTVKVNGAAKHTKAAKAAEAAVKHLNPALPFTSDFRATSPCWTSVQSDGVDESYDAEGYHLSFKRAVNASCPWTMKNALQNSYSIDLRAAFEEMPGPGAITVYFNDVGDRNYTSFFLTNNGTAIISNFENGTETLSHTVENAASSVDDVHVVIQQYADGLRVFVNDQTVADCLAVRLPHERIRIAIGGLANAGKGNKEMTRIAFKSFTLSRL